MQIERDDIRCRTGFLRQCCQKQFVNQPITFDPNPLFFRAFRVRRHHKAVLLPTRTHRDIRTVIECADQGTFRQGELLIGRQMQTGLHDWQLQEFIQLAAHDERQSEQVGQNGSRSVETIKPQQCRRVWQLVRPQVGLDRFHRSA